MMKANNKNTENLICIASIGKPRGLKGEFFLNSYCNPKENILEYSNFYIKNNSIPNFQIEYIKKLNSKFCAKVADINDIDAIMDRISDDLSDKYPDTVKFGEPDDDFFPIKF